MQESKNIDVDKIFRQQAKFIAGASKINQIPKNLVLPQIAFVGKSNVGKSSLINAICNHRNLARVSHTPGRTQQINFFSIGEKLILVDLPGYGFAKVPSQIRRNWEELIAYYLQNSSDLKLINVLIDSRRGVKPNDIEVIQLLNHYSKNFQIVFTKIDKLSKNTDELSSLQENFLASFNSSCKLIYTSSRSKIGAKTLKFSFAKYIKS
jgi:GTP-binding protein